MPQVSSTDKLCQGLVPAKNGSLHAAVRDIEFERPQLPTGKAKKSLKEVKVPFVPETTKEEAL